MSQSLKQLQNKGVKWNTLIGVLVLVIQIGVSITLNKIISPTYFGEVIWSFAIIQMALFLTNFSWHEILVRDQEVTQQKYSTAFFIGLITNLFLFGICYFGANYIIEFSSQIHSPRFIKLFSFLFFLHALVLVPQAKLTKDIAFKELSSMLFIAKVAASVVAIILALDHQYYLALIAMYAGTQVLHFVFIILYKRWLPNAVLDSNYVKQNLSLASSFVFQKLGNVVGERIDTVLIGTEYSKAETGTYNKSYGVQSMPVSYIAGNVAKVAMPSLARAKDDNEFHQLFSSAQHLIAFLLFPMFSMVFFLALPLARVYFNDNWDIPLIVNLVRVFAISGVFACFFTLFNSVLSLKASPTIITIVNVLQRVVLIVSVCIAYQYGLLFVAYAKLFTSLFSFLVYAYFVNKYFHIHYINTLLSLGKTVLISICAGLPAYFISGQLQGNVYVVFIVSAIVFGVNYLILSYLFNRKAFTELKEYFA